MVQYEWLPIKCTYCKMFGHSHEDCGKKDPQRKEWRVRAPPPTQQDQQALQTPPVLPEGEDEFQIVTRHITRRVVDREVEHAVEHISIKSFQTLSEQESVHNERVILNEGGRGSPPNG